MTNSFNPKTVTIGDTTWMAENLSYNDEKGGIIFNKKNNEYYYTLKSAKRIADEFGWEIPTANDWNKACLSCDDVVNDTSPVHENEPNYFEFKCNLDEKLRIKKHLGYYKYDLGSLSYQGYPDYPCTYYVTSSLGRFCTICRTIDDNGCVSGSHCRDNDKFHSYLSVRLIKRK